MHIPDGLMAPLVAAAGWLVAVAVLAFATRRVNRDLDDRRVPLMAVLAAGIFVAQMLNFPVGAGTTGHLVGAALAAMLLGPWGGMAVMMVILTIQCLLFGDGGMTALGLNFVNMGLIGCLVGHYVHRAFPEKYRIPGAFAAAWLAVFLGSLACALELSGSYMLSGGSFGIAPAIALPAMTVYHAIIGVGEALITTGVLAYLGQVAPEMLRMSRKVPGSPAAAGEVRTDG
ncbi:MAG: cobalamin biosynthesis protein CbiM [Euryarchaeota archaeon]|nr:cobalamin biosynthesis protein CbiM [Euryarchaeota archaeon]